MSGIVINQPDLPHWAVHVLHWLAMVGAIQQASGSVAVWKKTLELHLESGAPYPYDNKKTGKRTLLSGPACVYGIYQDFADVIEREANK